MCTRHFIALAVASAALITGCTSDDPTSESSAGPIVDSQVADSTVSSASSVVAIGDTDVVAGEAFPTARCEANREAGTITFLTGFDFAASASILDVIVAEDAGYYDALCLDVEIRSSFSTSNYPLIADDTAQFASGGSFSEVVAFAAANDADFVVTAVEGHSPIDTLIVKPGEATELSGLAGTTIGVKTKLPPSIEAMLLKAGLVEGEDFDTVLLDGFDPVQHISIPTIVGFPGYTSNEPGILERAGIEFDTFDPVDSGIPGSFGAIFTNRTFISEYPSAAEDFMRATMRGLADAVAEPVASAEIAVAKVNAEGNPNFLSPEGEVFRWETEAASIVDGTPSGTGLGIPDATALQVELDAYAEVDLFGGGETPDAASRLGNDIIASVYDGNGQVIWPGT